MKPLKPSMREKKRYLKVSGSIKDVEEAILDFSGTLGLARVSLRFIEKNIISINRESLNTVRASIAVWPKVIKIEKVSGSLKGLRKKKSKRK